MAAAWNITLSHISEVPLLSPETTMASLGPQVWKPQVLLDSFFFFLLLLATDILVGVEKAILVTAH